MEWIEPALDSYGVVVLYLGVLLYIAQTLRQQSKTVPDLIALASEGIKGTKNQQEQIDDFEERNEERSEALLEYLKNRDNKMGEALVKISTMFGTLKTGQTTMIAAQDSVLHKVTEMAEQKELQRIQEKLDELIKEVRILAEIRPLIERFGERLDTVEQSVDPLKIQIDALSPGVTEPEEAIDTPDGIELPKQPSTDSPASFSKSQAQQAKRKTDEQEVPAVKPDDTPPQETTDKPPTDATH